MDDLDSYLQSEIDNINDMFQQFETHDQQHERRAKDEEQKIMTKVGRQGCKQLLGTILCLSPERQLDVCVGVCMI